MSEYCQPHLERVGEEVPAVRQVHGTWMCQRCITGKSVRPLEEHVLLDREAQKLLPEVKDAR